jgi:hypothetical protein
MGSRGRRRPRVGYYGDSLRSHNEKVRICFRCTCRTLCTPPQVGPIFYLRWRCRKRTVHHNMVETPNMVPCHDTGRLRSRS